LLLLLFPPASHGGVEREWLPAMLCGETWVGGLLLQVELIHAEGITASMILCRQGGVISTSASEALHSSRGGSTTPCHQVVCPRWLGDGLRLRNFVGREPLSTLFLFLGGNAWRTPASGGGGTQGLDCLESLCSKVFSVKSKALSSNTRFLRESVARAFVKNIPANEMNHPGSSRPRPLFKNK
jgi:hypothetical protein